MAKYEAQMTHYTTDGTAVAPRLAPGEKRLIAQFHDEAAFQAWENKECMAKEG
jgi:hypothetical protein